MPQRSLAFSNFLFSLWEGGLKEVACLGGVSKAKKSAGKVCIDSLFTYAAAAAGHLPQKQEWGFSPE